ncbi:hypothetical protein STRIP9103_06149 [Streptomyces ipomoeae 91-03]|uniref:Uncharacterized protein n=1 Tax=Streptomyces ipomoeae 91-03 TaxID=698759 RepID=L1KTR4_9ACTN|nr:hypothetical protein STRIP9103_06149 [Streptomyces ipomoeae 91-03]
MSRFPCAGCRARADCPLADCPLADRPSADRALRQLPARRSYRDAGRPLSADYLSRLLRRPPATWPVTLGRGAGRSRARPGRWRWWAMVEVVEAARR